MFCNSILVRRVLLTLAVSLMLALLSRPSAAVPMFARQTGAECGACHVGNFGPQLTDFGRQFKLNGYTLGGATLDPEKHLSAMIYGGYTNLKQDLRSTDSSISSAPANRYSKNDNLTLDQASLFYGGAISDHIGMMGQVTYQDPVKQFHWDNTDIRYADTTQAAGADLTYGVTINNNFAMQDLWNTTPAWGFPYLSPTLTNTPGYNALVINGQAQKVLGTGVYGMWDQVVYG